MLLNITASCPLPRHRLLSSSGRRQVRRERGRQVKPPHREIRGTVVVAAIPVASSFLRSAAAGVAPRLPAQRHAATETEQPSPQVCPFVPCHARAKTQSRLRLLRKNSGSSP
jgi:hypothetical protein